MLLDLWSFAVILSDILEFIIYWAEHETFTVSFCLATLTFFILAYFAWRSTDIPHDVPSPPRPPFIITIQGTTVNNGGRRQSLSDVRILTSSPYSNSGTGTSEVTRRSTTVNLQAGVQVREENSIATETPTLQLSPVQNSRPILGIHGTRSLFFGFLRRRAVTRPILPTRPLLRTRFSQGPNLVVYHRIYHPSTPGFVTPAVLPFGTSSLGGTPNGPGTSNGVDNPSSSVVEPISSETLDERILLTRDSSSTSSTNPVQNHQESTGTSQLDSCRVLERSFSDSDLRELSYSSSQMSTDMDNRKPDVSRIPTSNLNIVEPTIHEDVKFTLKFLNDTQKDVTTQFNEKIVDFKRRHFATELSENKIVRLIFNGRVLDNDTKTLRESGIFDQCVVHCLIVTPQPSQQSQGVAGQSALRYGNRSGPRGPEPGMFFVSFMGIILVFLWFICFNFGQQLFTQSAVVSLSVLTAIFLIGLVAFYLPVHPNNPNQN